MPVGSTRLMVFPETYPYRFGVSIGSSEVNAPKLGQTPMAYVWHRRIALGVELLRASRLAMHLIAERCGFQSSHHFSRRVKQVVGVTPTQLCRQCRGDVDHTSSSEE